MKDAAKFIIPGCMLTLLVMRGVELFMLNRKINSDERMSDKSLAIQKEFLKIEQAKQGRILDQVTDAEMLESLRPPESADINSRALSNVVRRG